MKKAEVLLDRKRGDEHVLNDFQNLAIAQAIYQAIGGVVSTKGEGSLRKKIDDIAKKDYEESGIKSRNIVIDGQNVGTLTVRESADTREKVLRVNDRDAFTKWCEKAHENVSYEFVVTTDDKGVIGQFVQQAEKLNEMRFSIKTISATASVLNEREILAKAAEDGELPDGCEVVETGSAPSFIGTLLRVNAPAVAAAIGNELPTMVNGLLTNGK